MEERLQTGAILARAALLLGKTLPAALPAFLAMGAIGVAFDFYPDLGLAINLGVLISTFVGQYLVTRAAMSAAGLELSGRPGVATSFFGAVILIGIASGLGLLLLIVPGVYLYARWALTVPVIVGEGEKMSDAMRISTERTGGQIGPIAIALVIANLPWVAVLPVLFYLYPEDGTVSLPLSILASAGIYSAYLASWYCMVATYLLLQPSHELEEVFA